MRDTILELESEQVYLLALSDLVEKVYIKPAFFAGAEPKQRMQTDPVKINSYPDWTATYHYMVKDPHKGGKRRLYVEIRLTNEPTGRYFIQQSLLENKAQQQCAFEFCIPPASLI